MPLKPKAPAGLDWANESPSVLDFPGEEAARKVARFFTGDVTDAMNPMAVGHAKMPLAGLISMFKDKLTRVASTNEFLEQVKKLGPNIQQAGEEFAAKYPRVAAHTWPMGESGYYSYPANTPAAAITPYGKVEQRIPIEFTNNRAGRANADSLAESRANMFHEGAHVAQALGNSKHGDLYDEAERLVGYHDNPFEVTANYAGAKAAGFPTGDRPDNAIRTLQGFAQDLGPNSKLARLLNAPSATSSSVSAPVRSSALPMDQASRLDRAAEQGFTVPAYHGTKHNFTEFDGPIRKGNYGSGDFGIHVSEHPSASNLIANRAQESNDRMGLGNPKGPLLNHELGGQVMPLMVNPGRSLELPDMGIWRDPQSWVKRADLVDDQLKTNDPAMLERLLEEARRQVPHGAGYDMMSDYDTSYDWQSKLRELLQEGGYQSIRYPNFTEGSGEHSLLLLDPRQLRSRFAKFDPKNVNSRDLMASLAAMIGGGAAVSHKPEKP